MDIENEVVKAVMEDLYGGLPRQGPGSPACTRRAFSMLGPLPDRPLVLDVGCGTGAQTLELAGLTPGHIIGLDVFDWALDRLSEKVVAQGLAGRVHTTKQSMAEMDFREETFDLIWSEGALYIMGFESALKKCRTLLKPGGYLAASELCWLTDDAPPEARDFFASEYPEMKTVEDNVRLFSDCGFDLLGHFTEPDSTWWDDYYTPMKKLLPQLRKNYAAVPDALALFDESDAEMAIHEKYAKSYGYEFFVARKMD